MFISPFLAAVLIGTFWTGVGTATVLHHDTFDSSRSNVVISADVNDDHVTACKARFHSYAEDTDSYLGFDGSWHTCRL